MHAATHNNTRSHDHGLRDAMAKTSSLGESDNHMLNELKEIVLFLSQKIDDSDVRILSMEDKVRAQDATIEALKSEVGDATSFHRYLQSDDSDCLPQFRNTAFGPRCDFPHVTRFQNRTFFNDDVVFNENVEFDSDANCMPTYNSTTQMCSMNNNFTFDEGNITFDYNVRFDEDVRFNDDVRFRDTVILDSNVEFNNGGDVTFNKKVKFSENVLIKNENHDIELRLEDKVTARFYQDKDFKIDTHTTFYQDASMEKDLHIDGKLKVEKMTELDDLELYGYLWVDGETHLDGKLLANHHVEIKSGLNVKTGRLDVSRDGAKILGTTDVVGTFNLNGQGNAKKNFNVDGKLTATTAVIDNTAPNRNLQTIAFHQVPLEPALTVIGNADFDELYADRVRSNDPVDMDHILSQVRIDLKDKTLFVGDVTITNLNSPEPVLTRSRMFKLMEGMALEVDSITANSATINGQSVPDTPSSAELVNLLKNQNLKLNSLTTTSATIGGKTYPHTEQVSSSVTSMEVLNMLKGKELFVGSISASSMSTDTATIGGTSYPQSSSGKFDIDGFVEAIKNYQGEVSISKLTSDDLEITAAFKNINGNMVEVPGSLKIDGKDVALTRDVIRLRNRFDDFESDNTGQEPAPVTTSEILSALDGASLSVYSLDTKSLTKSGTEVPTMDDVGNMIGDAQVATDNAAVACTCSANDIEAVVTTSFVRGKVDENYVSSMGFMNGSALSARDSDCTCSASDVQNNIDQRFLEGLGVSFGPPECSCSSNFVTDVISSSYIQNVVDDLGVSYGDPTCTCSSTDIENVVTYDYIADKGFMDELSDCSCSIEDSQITDVIDNGYIAGLGFLTTCPCGVGGSTGDDNGF